jgi:hypothetical protein
MFGTVSLPATKFKQLLLSGPPSAVPTDRVRLLAELEELKDDRAALDGDGLAFMPNHARKSQSTLCSILVQQMKLEIWFAAYQFCKIRQTITSRPKPK